MILWNYLKNEMLKHQTQTVGEGDCSMSFEEIVIYSEIFSEKIKNELCCGIVCMSEMSAAIALLFRLCRRCNRCSCINQIR